MARQPGTLNVGSNFEVKASAPLDARTVVQTKTDLYTYEYFYRGMRVYVHDEGEYYELVNDLPTYEASWKAVSEGGGTDIIEMTDAEIDALFA